MSDEVFSEEGEAFKEFKEAIGEAYELVREYQFKLKDIETLITIRIYRDIINSGYKFDQSHYIATPQQASTYVTDQPFGYSEEDALNTAIRTFTTYYKAALKEGDDEPDPSWLEENEDFYSG